MRQELFIPNDVKEMTEKYMVDKGGICGQSCLAVIEKQPISKVIKDWKEMELEWKGWSGWRQLANYLKNKKFNVKQSRVIDDKNVSYIARVQWIGDEENKEKPYYGWKSWFEASANTHFIVIQEDSFFCNEECIWLPIDGEEYSLEGYLKHNQGLITSYLKIWE
ncbi:hypothetical protein LCGC14_1923430 [marine sediment metagenome]|uniref:Uncharacterized protein n=1 Tax=marine sediment metagenome TaxID=412755 RepID=A0A0F9FPV6_9ZZZZ